MDEKDEDVEENDGLAPHLLLYQLNDLRGVVALRPDDDVHIAVRFLFPSCPVVFLYWIFFSLISSNIEGGIFNDLYLQIYSNF